MAHSRSCRIPIQARSSPPLQSRKVSHSPSRFESCQQLALAPDAGGRLMAGLDPEGQLHALRWDMQAGWTTVKGQINQPPATSLAKDSFWDRDLSKCHLEKFGKASLEFGARCAPAG